MPLIRLPAGDRVSEVHEIEELKDLVQEYVSTEGGGALYLSTPRCAVRVYVEANRPIGEHTAEEKEEIRKDFLFMLFSLRDMYEAFK